MRHVLIVLLLLAASCAAFAQKKDSICTGFSPDKKPSVWVADTIPLQPIRDTAKPHFTFGPATHGEFYSLLIMGDSSRPVAYKKGPQSPWVVLDTAATLKSLLWYIENYQR